MAPPNNPGGAQVDYVRPGQGPSGSTLQIPPSVQARLLESNFSVNALRTCDVLRKEEWILFDDAVVDTAKERLVLAADLLNRGLRFEVPNPLGVTRIEWERLGEFSEAEVDMSGVSEATRDRPEYDLRAMPFPIIHKDFQVNIRALAASRARGEPLDTTAARLATRVVVEKIDSIVANGTTISQQTDGQIYGYLNAPNRSTDSVTATWVTATGAQILGDVIKMIEDAEGNHMYGPYVLIVPLASFRNMLNDFKTESDKTILQRIMEIPQIAEIVPTEQIAAPNALLVQMSSDVVEMVVGMQPTMLSWDSHGGMVTNFKVMAMMVPRIRDDKLGQSGIVHFS